MVREVPAGKQQSQPFMLVNNKRHRTKVNHPVLPSFFALKIPHRKSSFYYIFLFLFSLCWRSYSTEVLSCSTFSLCEVRKELCCILYTNLACRSTWTAVCVCNTLNFMLMTYETIFYSRFLAPFLFLNSISKSLSTWKQQTHSHIFLLGPLGFYPPRCQTQIFLGILLCC